MRNKRYRETSATTKLRGMMPIVTQLRQRDAMAELRNHAEQLQSRIVFDSDFSRLMIAIARFERKIVERTLQETFVSKASASYFIAESQYSHHEPIDISHHEP